MGNFDCQDLYVVDLCRPELLQVVTECPRRRMVSILKALNVLSSVKYFLGLIAFFRQPAR